MLELTNSKVWVFFYGSFMDESKLTAIGLHPSRGEAAMLPGYKIFFQPMANLIVSEKDAVYGLLAQISHSELEKLYTDLFEKTKEKYYPVAVDVELDTGEFRPALCYIAEVGPEKKPRKEYLESIVNAAEQINISNEYIDLLNTFG